MLNPKQVILSIRSVHNESALLEQVAQGEPEAFAALFYAYHQQLAEYIYRLTDSMEMTQDIVQDVFIKIWTKRETLPSLNSFTHYLFILSRNHAFNCLRQRVNEQARQQQWARQVEQEAIPSGYREDDYRAILDAAVAKLPPQQQKVYFLSRHKRLKHEEIATQLGISTETAKKHMKLALRSITQYVRNHPDAALLLVLLLH